MAHRWWSVAKCDCSMKKSHRSRTTDGATTTGATTGAEHGRDKSPWSFDYGYAHGNGTRVADNHGVRVEATATVRRIRMRNGHGTRVTTRGSGTRIPAHGYSLAARMIARMIVATTAPTTTHPMMTPASAMPLPRCVGSARICRSAMCPKITPSTDVTTTDMEAREQHSEAIAMPFVRRCGTGVGGAGGGRFPPTPASMARGAYGTGGCGIETATVNTGG